MALDGRRVLNLEKEAFLYVNNYCDLLQDRPIIPSGKMPHDVML
jgi:hypothetical protein